jgi:hypothetical protein
VSPGNAVTERHDLPVPASLIKPASNTALDIVAAATQVVAAPKDTLFTTLRLRDIEDRFGHANDMSCHRRVSRRPGERPLEILVCLGTQLAAYR